MQCKLKTPCIYRGGGRGAHQQNAAKNAKVKSENEFKLLLNSPYKYAHMHERAKERENVSGANMRGRGGRGVAKAPGQN